MGAHLRHRARIERDDEVGGLHRRGAVGDEDGRAVAHEGLQPSQDLFFGMGVHVREGIVEHEDRGRLEERPRQRSALLLPAGERHPALTDHGVEAIAELLKVVHELRGLEGRLQLFVAGVRAAVADVVAQGVGEEERFLGHEADRVAQGTQRILAHVAAIDEHLAPQWILEADEQVHEGGLSSARESYECDRRPCRDAQVDVVQHLLALIASRYAA